MWLRIAWHVLTEIGGMTLLEHIKADHMFVICDIRQMLVEQLMVAAEVSECIARRFTYGFLRIHSCTLSIVVGIKVEHCV